MNFYLLTLAARPGGDVGAETPRGDFGGRVFYGRCCKCFTEKEQCVLALEASSCGNSEALETRRSRGGRVEGVPRNQRLIRETLSGAADQQGRAPPSGHTGGASLGKEVRTQGTVREKGARLGLRRHQREVRVTVQPLVGSGQAGGCAGVNFSESQCRSPGQ